MNLTTYELIKLFMLKFSFNDVYIIHALEIIIVNSIGRQYESDINRFDLYNRYKKSYTFFILYWNFCVCYVEHKWVWFWNSP